MTKLFVTLPALALVVALSGSAKAENGAISSATLNEMGLAGMQMMSDADAMAIRGLGFSGGDHMPKPSKNDKPWTLAFGVSYATLQTGDGVAVSLNGGGGHGGYDSLGSGSAGTVDGFIAEGKYLASGSHLSEAKITKTDIYTTHVPGVGLETKTHTRSLYIGAGGNASSLAF